MVRCEALGPRSMQTWPLPVSMYMLVSWRAVRICQPPNPCLILWMPTLPPPQQLGSNLSKAFECCTIFQYSCHPELKNLGMLFFTASRAYFRMDLIFFLEEKPRFVEDLTEVKSLLVPYQWGPRICKLYVCISDKTRLVEFIFVLNYKVNCRLNVLLCTHIHTLLVLTLSVCAYTFTCIRPRLQKLHSCQEYGLNSRWIWDESQC
mgnify:CR=1 FL=1